MSLRKTTVVKRRLKAAIRKAVDNGAIIHHNGTGVRVDENGVNSLDFGYNGTQKPRVCAYIAASIGSKADNLHDGAAENLGITTDEALAIECGFCDFSLSTNEENNLDYFNLGIEVRNEIIKEGLYPNHRLDRDYTYKKPIKPLSS